jgi:hypothetical protein
MNSLCGLLRYIFIAFEKIIWSRIVMYKYRLHSALLCVLFFNARFLNPSLCLAVFF